MKYAIVNFKQFAMACENKTNKEIQELFATGISQRLQEAIYMLGDELDPHIITTAFPRLGAIYNVEALVKFKKVFS